jgi:hypothetical protein
MFISIAAGAESAIAGRIQGVTTELRVAGTVGSRNPCRALRRYRIDSQFMRMSII